MQRAHAFSAPVPRGAAMLTAGIDMQQDRLEVEIVGWGLGEESWSIDYRVLWGDPLRPEVWAELDAVLAETWSMRAARSSGSPAPASTPAAARA